jgi:formate dehydrogenase (coenzyme F420) beta subunit
MVEYTQKIREIARRLLEEKKVDVFIGYRKGSVPMMNEPILIKDPADAEMLHWDSHCGLNLCNYLTKRTDRVGIVANGCNSRNIVTHIVENQIKREQIFIVGIPCTGMVDHRAVSKAVGRSEILEVTEEGESFTVSLNGLRKTFPKADFLRSNCSLCLHRNPVECDEMVGDPVVEQQVASRFEDVEAIEKMTPEEKRRHFAELISPCIRCYACRNACPLCYCPTCFVDESRPQWVGKSMDPIDTMTFHFLRAYHCAGRCTDCGACERACPVGIPVREFTSKLNKDALDLFGWEAGLDRNQRPPLDLYKVDDYNDFVK